MKRMTKETIGTMFVAMRNFTLLVAAVLSMVFVSCHDYDHEIADLEDRLEMIESITVPDINQQITNINNSITELQNVDVELNNYIKSVEATAADLQVQLNATNEALRQTNADLSAAKTELNGKIDDTANSLRDELASAKAEIEAKLAVVNTELASLKAKDVELDGKIAALQAYVDNDLKKYIDDADASNKAWATATFSTLEQYAATQQTISEINLLIQKINDDMVALENRVNKKIDTDVANALTALRAEIAALKSELQGDYSAKLDALDSKLAQSVTEVTEGYTAAVATAKSEITDAYTSAIDNAITASEAGMKTWVDSTLVDGYYKKAEVDAQLAVLDTLVNTNNNTLQGALGDAKAEIQTKLDEQKAALDKAQADLTAAYQQAISTAIETNNGIIEGKIADAANNARVEVNTQLAVIDGKIVDINNEIQKIWNEISSIKEKIATIEQQIENINSSIVSLQNMDSQLDAYIKSLEATAADLQAQLNAANAKIDDVKSQLGDEIDALEQNLLSQLEAAKQAIADEIAGINNTIADLKAKDTELDGKITALQNYVDNDLKKYIDDADVANKNWATATFATLAQYDAIQLEISNIKSDITNTNNSIAALKSELEDKIATDIKNAIDALRTELNADYVAKIQEAVDGVTAAYTTAIAAAKSEIETAYTAAIASAISTSEAGMKQWVNEKLAGGYYTAAEVDALLNVMKSEISDDLNDVKAELNAKVAAQQTALETAKTELTAAYTQAINDAINTNNGVVDQKIKDAVDAAKAELQTRIDAINTALDALKAQVDELEKNFLNRIQSVSFVPEFADGKVKMDYATRKTSLDFLISPANLASTLKTAWDGDNNVITAYVRYTSDPLTRAVGEIVKLNVTAVTADASGMLTVSVAENSANALSADFWKGDVESVVYIQISDGNNNIVSSMIPMIAHGYVSLSNTINGFSNGQTSNGVIVE